MSARDIGTKFLEGPADPFPFGTEPGVPGVLVWLLDASRKTLVAWNAYAAEACGWTQRTGASSPRDLSQIVTIETETGPRALEFEHIRGALGGGPVARRGHGWLRCSDGRSRRIVISADEVRIPRRQTYLLIAATLVDAGGGREPLLPAAGPLAAGAAHQLNNISASLSGFVDLVAQAVGSERRVSEYLAELQIGVARIQELAFEMECMGDRNVESRHVRISDCLTAPSDMRVRWSFRVAWHCDPAILVDADPMHGRRAALMLAKIARGSAEGTELTVRVRTGSVEAMPCAVCAMPIASGWVAIGAQVRETSLFPQQPSHSLLRSRGDLSRAALSCSAHRAGGHVVQLPSSGSLEFVLRAGRGPEHRPFEGRR